MEIQLHQLESRTSDFSSFIARKLPMIVAAFAALSFLVVLSIALTVLGDETTTPAEKLASMLAVAILALALVNAWLSADRSEGSSREGGGSEDCEDRQD